MSHNLFMWKENNVMSHKLMPVIVTYHDVSLGDTGESKTLCLISWFMWKENNNVSHKLMHVKGKQHYVS